MATVLYANNASTTLAGSVSTGATSCTVLTGTGALFPSPTSGQYFVMTFTDAATGLIDEIVHVTSVSGDVFTIVRAQEGTTAKAWAVADNVENLWTAGSASALAQVVQVQSQTGNFADDTGTANAVVASLSPAVTSLASIVGMPIRILKVGSANSGAVTLNLNSLGATSIILPNGNTPGAGTLAASGIFEVIYNGTLFQLMSGYATPQSGIVFHYAASTPPSGALVRNGAAISRATYAGLNALASAASYAAPWGPGNGTTTFNLPNDFGLFDRGWDSGGSVDPGRGFGSQQAFGVESHSHQFGIHSQDSSGGVAADGTGTQTAIVTTTAYGIGETRPVNRAYLPCIYI